MIGASSGAAGSAGYFPAPQAGDEGKLPRGDGTWVTALGDYSGEVAGGSVAATSTSAGDWYVINARWCLAIDHLGRGGYRHL